MVQDAVWDEPELSTSCSNGANMQKYVVMVFSLSVNEWAQHFCVFFSPRAFLLREMV